MSEMILLVDMYGERIGELQSQIGVINQTKVKLNGLLKSFSAISGVFGGYDLTQLGNNQATHSTTEIAKLTSDIKQSVVILVQTIQLRYDNAYRYLDVMTYIRDLIMSISSINNLKDTRRA